jgi:hypothetical protein
VISPRFGEGNLGPVPGGRNAVVAVGEPGCEPAPSTVERLPLEIPVIDGSTPGFAPVADWPW